MKRRSRRTNRVVQNTRPATADAKATETKIEETNTGIIEETVKVEEPAVKKEELTIKEQPIIKEVPATVVSEEAEEHTSEEKEPGSEPKLEKKARARRTSKATLHHYVQFAGYEVSADELAEKVKADYKARTGAAASGEICVYIKPEEGVAYYSVNGEGSPEFKVNLQ